MEQAPLEEQPLVERALERRTDGFFGHLRRRLGFRGDQLRHGLGFDVHFPVGDDAGDQAAALRLGGIDLTAGEDHVHGLGLAHRTSQALRSAHSRDHAQVDLRLPEHGCLARDDHIGHQSQLAPSPQGVAVDTGHDRCAQPREPVPGAEPVCRVHLGIVLLRHLLDIGPGREGLLGAEKEDRADRRVGVERRGRLDDFLHQLGVERIERLRAVELDPAYALGAGDFDRAVGFLCHAALVLSERVSGVERVRVRAARAACSALA